MFTKASLYEKDGAVAHSLKRDSIRREVEANLERLQLGAIDAYQVHWPNPTRTSRRRGQRSPS